MMLPNPCAVSAHQRIHKHRAPHVCPECGGVARQASFQTHLEEACLHFARRIGYRWAATSRSVSALSPSELLFQLSQTLPATRLRPYFCSHRVSSRDSTSETPFHVLCVILVSRCSSCQVVFGGLNSIKSHIQTAHCEVFHKCPSCPMAFKSSPSAQSHISTQHPTLTGGQAK